MSLVFVSKDPIENKSVLVQVMACHRTGDKPLAEPTMTQSYMRLCELRSVYNKDSTHDDVIKWKYFHR